MIFYVDGRFVPEEEAVVSVLDRSFLYGDGLFETVRSYGGRLFLWAEHLDRLTHGAHLLQIPMPETPARLTAAATELLRLNQVENGLLRIQLTRGVGRRGYSISGADNPRIIITLHPAPPPEMIMPRFDVWISSIRIPAHDPLAAVKTCNKLHQILARAEAELAGAHEAVLLNTEGLVAEAATSNLFWVEGGAVFTPPVAAGALAGVTRGFVMKLCAELQIGCHEAALPPSKMTAKDGLFLTTSSLEIVEVASVNAKPVASSPVTRRLREAYRAATGRS